MTRYRLTFDAQEVWVEDVRPVIESYLQGEVRAYQAAELLGWSKEQFALSMAGLFSLALDPDQNSAQLEAQNRGKWV